MQLAMTDSSVNWCLFSCIYSSTIDLLFLRFARPEYYCCNRCQWFNFPQNNVSVNK